MRFGTQLMLGTAIQYGFAAMGIGFDTADGGGSGGGEPDSSASGNNGGGNPADSGDPANGQDNNGQETDLSQFWDNGDEGAADDDSDFDAGAFGQTLMQEIQDTPIPDLFSTEIAEQLAEGNLDAANQNFQNLSRQMVQTSVLQAAKLMEAVTTQIEKRVQSMIDGKLGAKDQQTALNDRYQTQMADAKLAPVIRGVYNQALKRTKNDTSKALDLTDKMLSELGIKKSSNGNGIPAPGSTDSMGGGPKALVQELLQAEGN